MFTTLWDYIITAVMDEPTNHEFLENRNFLSPVSLHEQQGDIAAKYPRWL